MQTQSPPSSRRSPVSSVVSYKGVHPTLHETVFLADGARVVGDVVLGKNCSVWFNAVVRGDVNSVTVGDETNIQDGAIVRRCVGEASKQCGGWRLPLGNFGEDNVFSVVKKDVVQSERTTRIGWSANGTKFEMSHGEVTA